MSKTPRDETDPDILALMPSEPFMQWAWLGSLQYTITNPNILAAFREDTGCNYTPSRSPIEQMIDRATGADKAFLLELIRWHNYWIWGEVEGHACNGNEPEFINAVEII